MPIYPVLCLHIACFALEGTPGFLGPFFILLTALNHSSYCTRNSIKGGWRRCWEDDASPEPKDSPYIVKRVTLAFVLLQLCALS